MQDKKLIVDKLRETSNHMDLAVEAGERGDWPRMREALLEIEACARRLATVVEPASLAIGIEEPSFQSRSNHDHGPSKEHLP